MRMLGAQTKEAVFFDHALHGEAVHRKSGPYPFLLPRLWLTLLHAEPPFSSAFKKV